MNKASLWPRAVLALLLALLLVPLWPQPASAHPANTSLLYLDVTSTALSGRVEIPYVDLAEIFDLDPGGSADIVRSEIESNLATLQDYVDEHTSIGAAGEVWPLEFEGFDILEEAVTPQGFAVFPFDVGLPLDAVPRQLDVTFDVLFDELPDRESIVLVGNDWLAGVIDAESNRLVLFTPDDASGTVDLGDTSEWKNFTGSISSGVDHMRTGPDHIFFILVLVLPSVLVFRTEWEPASRFVSSLWRVLKIALMFTIAHSITFTLAGLELIPLPSSRLVESIIALSIAVAALHNLRPIFHNREWLLAFAFGLFHGLGFASLVSGLDVGRQTQLVSLLGRNLGIELGQSLLIVLVFPTLFVLRRTRLYRPIFVFGSIALAFVAVLWTVERVFDLDFKTDAVISRIVDWPRSLVLLVIAFIVAAGIAWNESRNGRLLPATDDTEDAVQAAAQDAAASDLASVG